MRSKMRELVHATGTSPLQYLQQLDNDVAEATMVINKKIADAAAQLKVEAGKAQDDRNRELVTKAIDFLTQVGKASLVTETLGL
jgi:hypothetical protein